MFGIPINYDGGEKVKACHAEVLALGSAIADFTLSTDTQGVFQGVMRFAFVQTDPVVGLADVFGDTISVAADIDQFAVIIEDCLDAPSPYLERAMRAHDIVQAAHTFDHRAVELARIIDVIAARKRLTY